MKKFLLVLILSCLIFSCDVENSSPILSETNDDNSFRQDTIFIEKDNSLDLSVYVNSVELIPPAMINGAPTDEFKTLAVSLKNYSDYSANIVIKSSITGYSLETTSTIVLDGKTESVIYFNPTFPSDWSQKVTNITPANYNVEIFYVENDTTRNIYSQSLDIKLYPKDHFFWGLNDLEEYKDFTEYLVKFILPLDSAVEELVNSSIKNTPNESFSDYQNTSSCYYGGVCLIKCPVVLGDFVNVEVNFGEKISNTYSINSQADFPINLLGNEYIRIYGNDEAFVNVYYDNKYIAKSNVATVKYTSTKSLEVANEDLSLVARFGVLNEVDMQVKAIYETLQNEFNVKYVNSTVGFSLGGFQKIVMPEDVLKYGEANCVDGTLIMASALENIGIMPVLIGVPNHMYLGYYRDKDKTDLQCVETTLLGGESPFTSALSKGNEKYAEDKTNLENKEEGYFSLDVEELRKEWVLPLVKQIK